jgi:hypothetical protein
MLLSLADTNISDFKPSEYVEVFPTATAYIVTSISVPIYIYSMKTNLFNEMYKTALRVVGAYISNASNCYVKSYKDSRDVSETCGLEGVDDIVMLRTLYLVQKLLTQRMEQGRGAYIPQLFYLSQILKSIDTTIAAIKRREPFRYDNEIISDIENGNTKYLSTFYKASKTVLFGVSKYLADLALSFDKIYLPLRTGVMMLSVRYSSYALRKLENIVEKRGWWL